MTRLTFTLALALAACQPDGYAPDYDSAQPEGSDGGDGGDGSGGDGGDGGDAGDGGDGGDGGDAADAGDGGDGGDTAEPSAIPPDPGALGPFDVVTTTGDVYLPNALYGYLPADVVMDIYLPVGAPAGPVVLFSHGYMLSPSDYASYGEHLASWGYVAVLPALPQNILIPSTHVDLAGILRSLMDWVQGEGSAAGGPLAGAADTSRLALGGHSMGGKVSLLAAAEDSRPMASFTVDPVDAGSPMPLAEEEDYPSVTPEQMGSLSIPLGFIGETVDTVAIYGDMSCAPAEDNFHQYYLHATSPALEVEVMGASHMAFLDNPDCGVICSACQDSTVDEAGVRALTQRTMTAFYNVFLMDQPEYGEWLTGAPMEEDEATGRLTFDHKNGL